MNAEVGARVGAVSHTEGTKLYIYGYGVYEGNKAPGKGISFMGIDVSEIKNYTNPCIKLDNGKIVWGCECWWGTEEKIKKMATAFDEVITVDIEEERAKAKAS